MGKPKHSNDPRGEQKGAQEHAEGQHGPKAYAARKDEINAHHAERGTDTQRSMNDPRAHDAAGGLHHEPKIADPAFERDGGHQLFENRLQHDEADRESAKNRIRKDVQKHHHEREQFQIEGGRETHPALPQDPPFGTVKSPGDAGGNRKDSDRGHH